MSLLKQIQDIMSHVINETCVEEEVSVSDPEGPAASISSEDTFYNALSLSSTGVSCSDSSASCPLNLIFNSIAMNPQQAIEVKSHQPFRYKGKYSEDSSVTEEHSNTDTETSTSISTAEKIFSSDQTVRQEAYPNMLLISGGVDIETRQADQDILEAAGYKVADDFFLSRRLLRSPVYADSDTDSDL